MQKIKMKSRKELEDLYNEKFANPYIAASYGYIDDVFEPKFTRQRLIDAFNILRK